MRLLDGVHYALGGSSPQTMGSCFEVLIGGSPSFGSGNFLGSELQAADVLQHGYLNMGVSKSGAPDLDPG